MNFNSKRFIEKKLKEIEKIIDNKKVLAAVSGGVDSFVSACLVHKVIGERLKVIFIDDGFMRLDEPRKVIAQCKKLEMNTKLVNAKKDFFSALKGITDPEEKRKAFRDIFYKTLAGQVEKEKVDFLVQGTILADIKETKKGIKTQHNVLAQIGISSQKYKLKIVEPLKELYKPQVRKVAKRLGLAKDIYERMPFPGPGLATRIVGEVVLKRVKILKIATKIVEEEIKKAKLKPFQAFAVLLNDKATGIKKGKRIFGNIIVIRSVDSRDALTAKITNIPKKVLERIQNKITSKIPCVCKVLFDITPKPPSTIEYI